MPQRSRAMVAVLAAAVLIVLFVVLSPGDDDDDPTTSTQAAATSTTIAPAGTTPDAVSTTATADASPPPAPEPDVTRIRVKGLKPVGGVEKIKAEKGDTVRFTVTSDQQENVHLHGYDVERDVGPGRRASFNFKADIEGIFEIELEQSAVPIAELRVEP